jgi:ribosome assembly protein SQT1
VVACAVIPIQDDAVGEVPKAFVVKSTAVGMEENDRIEQYKARYKWLRGGAEFIDMVPKSPSGKILRRVMRDKEKETCRAKGGKL